jgi:acyl carrier protein
VVDQAFIGVVRRHLRFLAPSEELAPDARLHDLGLDSIAAVALLLDLENELGIAFDESSLNAETFASAASLWNEIARATRP